jgi:hypothetical protein
MGDIIIANTVVDGTAPTGDQISQNFYDELNGDNSLETINGNLQNANRLPAWKITREHIQHGTFTGGQTVGSTANLDYMLELFTGYDPSNDQNPVDPEGAFIPIPGANLTFHLDHNVTGVLVMWNVLWASDSWASTDVSNIRLHVEGVGFPNETLRRLGKQIERPNPAGQRRIGKWRDRVYSGHWFWGPPAQIAPAAGWHTVGLRVACKAKHTRIRIRQLSIVWFL